MAAGKLQYGSLSGTPNMPTFRNFSRCLVSICSIFLFAPVLRAAEGDRAATLAQILADKGTISLAELVQVQSATGADRLSTLKGILSQGDMARLSPAPAPVAPAETTAALPVASAKASEPPTSRPSATPSLDPSFETGKRIPVSLYGTVLFNAGYNTAAANIEDVPLFLSKQNTDPTGGDKNFSSTVRQSRFGVALDPVDTLGAKLSGDFEFDMFGGQTALPGGSSMNLFRMRLAYGRLDWKNVAVEVGQDWTVFAPLNPISFASYGIPSLTGSGNAWARSPQIRIETKHSNGSSTLYWQTSLSDPNLGDYPAGLFSTSRQPLAGERGRIPAFDSRVAYRRVHNDRSYTVGLSGHYGRGKNFGLIGTRNVQSPIDSWGVALDYSLPLTRKLSLVGEAYEGRALGYYSSAIAESIGAVGTAGAHGVESRGGWMQAQTSFNKQWQLNLGYGIDSPNASQILVGNRLRNQTYMGNIIYKLNLNIGLALEYRRLLTDFRNQPLGNERGDHADLAIFYTF